MKLFLKGNKCVANCTLDKERRQTPPGQHGSDAARRKMTEYGVQLREKQKIRRIYRVLEGPFRRYLHEAERRRGVTGESLLQLLETRFDNVVYRLGFAVSRSQARQLVSHRHFVVNGVRVNIPSYQLKPGDVITVHETMLKSKPIQEARQRAHTRSLPDWLQFDHQALTGQVVSIPTRDQIDVPVEEQLVIEFYSR